MGEDWGLCLFFNRLLANWSYLGLDVPGGSWDFCGFCWIHWPLFQVSSLPVQGFQLWISSTSPTVLSLAYVLMLKSKALHFHLAQFLEQRLVDIYMLFTMLNCKFIYPSFSAVVSYIFILLIPFKVRIVTVFPSYITNILPAPPPPAIFHLPFYFVHGAFNFLFQNFIFWKIFHWFFSYSYFLLRKKFPTPGSYI